MARKENLPEQISLKQEIARTQGKEKPWTEIVRLGTASNLAYGLFGLFAFTILSSIIVISILTFRQPVLGLENGSSYPAEQIKLIVEFAKAVLPYVATPLGIALGFFFRESKSE